MQTFTRHALGTNAVHRYSHIREPLRVTCINRTPLPHAMFFICVLKYMKLLQLSHEAFLVNDKTHMRALAYHS